MSRQRLCTAGSFGRQARSPAGFFWRPEATSTARQLTIQCGRVSAWQNIQDRREEILRVAARHGAGNVSLFGSVVRGEETPESDVDLLVDVTGDTTAWFPGSLVADLEQMLGRPVQLVIRRSLSPLIRESVLREAVPL